MSAGIRHLAIVAGGKGSRMGPAFEGLPKALIPIGGKPVLQHQLELAAGAGITEVSLFTGYLADRIAGFVGDGSRFGLKVRLHAEPKPLGNAGAVLAALDDLPDQLFVLYGDVMAAVDLKRLAAFHLERGADFTTLAHPNDHPADSDLLEVDADDRVTAVRPYPHPPGAWFSNLVNAALYAVRRDALRALPLEGAADFSKDVMPGLIGAGAKVLAWRSGDYIKDMGAPGRLEHVEADFRAGRIRLPAPGRGRKAVFLDRDGTLNVERRFVGRAEDFELLPGAGDALRRLRQAGYMLVLVTNQPVIARGEASEADVARVHKRLEWELGEAGAFLDAIYLCPHHPDAGFPGERRELKVACDCRKPATGLVDRACGDLGIDPTSSWMVGDQTRDIEMARRAGLRSVLVRTGLAGRDGAFERRPDAEAANIAEAAELIVRSHAVAAA